LRRSLWAAAYFLGVRIDVEKAERAVLEEESRAEHPSGGWALPNPPI